MSADRYAIMESRQMRTGAMQPVERDVKAAAKLVAEEAKWIVDAFMEQGFSMDAAIMLCGQVLPKLL